MKLIGSTLVFTLLIFNLAACQQSGGGAAAPLSTSQLKGAWEMTAVGDRNGNVFPLSASTNKDKVQLFITDTDFRLLVSDDRGLKDDHSEKYKFDGKHMTMASDSSKWPHYDVLSVSQTELKLINSENPPDPQETAPISIYRKIDEKQLALNKFSHIPQSIEVSYSSDSKKLQGEIKGQAEFRSTENNKTLDCVIYKNGEYPNGALFLHYYEFSRANGEITVASDKNASISFAIPAVSFDFSKSQETIQKDVVGGTSSTIFYVNDPVNKSVFMGGESSKCSFSVDRVGTSLKISGTCNGTSTNYQKDPSGSVTVNSNCELEDF